MAKKSLLILFKYFMVKCICLSSVSSASSSFFLERFFTSSVGYSVLDIGYSPALRDPAKRDGLLDIHDFVPLGGLCSVTTGFPLGAPVA